MLNLDGFLHARSGVVWLGLSGMVINKDRGEQIFIHSETSTDLIIFLSPQMYVIIETSF